MISIALATYNGERFLREQLDSIIEQSYANWELHVCDDCSSDCTCTILREYEKKDSRIHIHYNEHNLGFKKNFEKAISFCTGKYIALADQDDIWFKNHLEQLMYNIDGCLLVCSNAEHIDANGSKIGRLQKDPNMYLSNLPEEQFFQILFLNYVQGCTVLFHSELKEFFLPIPDEQPFHDYWLGIVAASQGCVKYIKEPTMYYRQHANSVTCNKVVSISERLSDITKVYVDLYEAHKPISRLPLSEGRKKMYKLAMDYLKGMSEKSGRYHYLFFFIKYYSLIHMTKSYKFFIPRFFKRFIFKR